MLLAAAAAAGVVAAVRVAPFGPHVEAYAVAEQPDVDFEYHTLRMRARGGEDLAQVRIEAETDGVTVQGKDAFEHVPTGLRFSTRLKVLYGDDSEEERVRVWVAGHEDGATLVRVTRRPQPE